jgi:transposase
VRGDHLGRDRRSLNWKLPARYAGLDVTLHSSDGKRWQGHLSRQGSPELRSAAFETAKRATFAVERKLLRRCCYSLRKLGDASDQIAVAETCRRYGISWQGFYVDQRRL